ncbi:MAG: hypothetical protein V2A64_04120 [Candidatus Omnitrophota bacterium]
MKRVVIFCCLLLALGIIFTSQLGYAGEAMIAYGEGTSTIPVYRVWNGSVWSGALYANNVGGAVPAGIKWVVLRACPVRDEFILGTLDGNNRLNVQVYQGGQWGNLVNLSAGCDSTYRRFDIVYETATGEAMVVFVDGTALKYRKWNGTSWVTSAPDTITLPTTAGTVAWVQLAANPGITSKEIILETLDLASDVCGVVWNGAAWGSGQGLEDATEVYNRECISVGYGPDGKGIVAWSEGAKTTGGPQYRIWSGGVWSAATPATYVPATGNEPIWIRWANCPTVGKGLIGCLDDTSDLNVNTWGTTFEGNKELTAGLVTNTSRCFDLAGEGEGGNQILACWGDLGVKNIKFNTWNGSWSGTAGSGPLIDAVPNGILTVNLSSDLYSQEMLLAGLVKTAAGAIKLCRWNGADFDTTVTDCTYDSSVEIDSGYQPFMIAHKIYYPPLVLTQKNYHWYANADNVQPGNSLAGENAAISGVTNGDTLRLRMNIGAAGRELKTGEFKLQYSNSTDGPWQGVEEVWGSEIDVVDTSSSITAPFMNQAIALDNLDNPRLVYSTPTLSLCTPGDSGDIILKYAKWTGSAWVKETLEKATFSIPACAPGDICLGVCLDFGGFSKADMALDTNNNPRLSYYSLSPVENQSLRYASYSGSSWTFKTVDSGLNLLSAPWFIGGPATEGQKNTSIALDSTNTAHISYFKFNTTDSTYDLKYARSSGGTWAKQSVATGLSNGAGDSCLAIDSTNNPHLCYFNGSALIYARYTGSWVQQTVDDPSGGIYLIGEFSMYISFALDTNNNPHISYYDYVNQDLKYAYYTGSEWVIQTIDSVGRVGRYTSLVLDSNNNPHISYCDDNNRDLKYAYYTGSEWFVQKIYDGQMASTSSLNIDEYKRPHLSFNDSGVSGLSDMKYYGHYTTMVDILRGADNSSVTDGTIVTGNLLSGSTVREAYEAHNNSILSTTIPKNGYGEWDWVIKNFSAPDGTYYFRMAYSGGAALDNYENYPRFTIGGASPAPGKAKITHWEEVR